MNYLVICKNEESFYTDWFNYENLWSDQILCVIKLYCGKISFDGKTWKDIEYDHL